MFANVKWANAARPLTYLSEQFRRYESCVQLAWLPVTPFGELTRSRGASAFPGLIASGTLTCATSSVQKGTAFRDFRSMR